MYATGYTREISRPAHFGTEFYDTIPYPLSRYTRASVKHSYACGVVFTLTELQKITKKVIVVKDYGFQ